MIAGTFLPMTRVHPLLKKALVCSAVLIVGSYELFTGPRNLDRYPAAQESPYKLPWPAGQSWFCAQSNRGIVSHRDGEEYAFDFKMPVGSPICAARGGVIVGVDDTHDGNGLKAPGNVIVIDHGDGTRAAYIHLKKGGSLVAVGDQVAQGEKIGLSGNVGRSIAPHLHFHVFSIETGRTIPISFSDVKEHAGVPRMFCRYVSGNR